MKASAAVTTAGELVKPALLLLLPLLAGVVSAAEQIEELDAEFLDYLAEMEADVDDDWTLLAASQDGVVTEHQKISDEKEARKSTKPASKSVNQR